MKLIVFVAHPEFVSFVVVLLVAAGLALGAVLVRTVGDSRVRPERQTAGIVLLLLSGLVVAFGASWFLVAIGRWGYLLALLPGTAIARHAVYMRLIRRRTLAAPVAMPIGARRAPQLGDDEQTGRLEVEDPGLLVVFARARQMHDRDFAPDTLVARFGIPALLTTFIGIGVFEFLRTAASKSIDGRLVNAAWFGAAGAMVYVLLYLGQRAFRNDITTGAALWSAIVLALGPLFGAIFSLIWVGDPTGADQIPWTHNAVYFVAGMAPRHAASAVEEAVRRLWLARVPASQAPSRLQPLSQLRGITPAIEDRLAEEGIADVQGMAMADPLKLFRSTSFDKRQILSWMDEALLMSWLPDYWNAVQKVGVTGAIDLMAHVQQREGALRGVLANSSHLEPAAVEAVILAGTILKEDTQLRLVWALYQFDEDGLDGPGVDAADGSGAGVAPSAGVSLPAWGWLLAALGLMLAAGTVGDTRLAVAHVAVCVAFLWGAFAVTITVRWPWSGGPARALPLLLSGLAIGGALAAHHAQAGDAWQWPLRDIFAAAAAICGGVFLVALVVTSVGGTLTIDFPNGVPPRCELWVADQAVDIASPMQATVCRLPARRVDVVVRWDGMEQRRRLDARGKRTARMSVPLPATLVLQPDPPEARVLRLWVDGAETAVGPVVVWPRTVAYDVVAEAEGFLPASRRVAVTTAGPLPIPMAFLPHPSPPPTAVQVARRAGTASILVDSAGMKFTAAPRGVGEVSKTSPPVATDAPDDNEKG